MALVNTGYLEYDELKSLQKLPTEERFAKGPVAILECVQEIPCNPCEAACKFGAIEVGEPITNLPTLLDDKCMGCGMCVAQCPGLAIVVVDKTYSKTTATVAFPFEYPTLPEVGEVRDACNRRGEVLCLGKIVKIVNPVSYDHTPVVTVEIPKEFADEVRTISRTPKYDDNMIVCRCEEITVGEIKEAIKNGARDVVGVKRRTRAGMGLCQGRTCEKLVQQILCAELSVAPDAVGTSSARPPVRPITFGELAKGDVCE